MRQLAKCFAFLFCCGLALPAHGQTTCNLVSATMAFGTYDTVANAATDKTALGTIQINCTGAASLTISLAVGTGTFAARTMSGSGSTLYYNLYADAGYTEIWGDGTSGTVTVPFTFSASGTQSIPVYGKIPHGQSTSAGITYIASPQVTLTW